jgi:NADPH2:quinone reductase
LIAEPFTAFRIHQTADGRVSPALETIRLDDLTPGEIVVRVRYSSINYKDALAATGRGAILSRFPLVGGIDLAGDIVASGDARWPVGTGVLACGCGLGESRDGGYAHYARIATESAVALPAGLDCRSAMALGTAGLTAALAIAQMEHNGQRPELGPIAVSGASGGVGSLSIDMLAARGYAVVAVSGKSDANDYLRALGATEVVDRAAFAAGGKPLATARFGGAIDCLGGDVLASFLKSVRPRGNVASIGLAASPELHTTVLPFILRGVNLLGINSADVPQAQRAAIWQRLGADLKPRHLDVIAAHEVSLPELPAQFASYVESKAVGRTVVKIAG